MKLVIPEVEGWASVKVPDWLMRRGEITPGAKLLYGLMARYAGKNGQCFPRQSKLAADMQVSARWVQAMLKELVDAKLVKVIQTGKNQSNCYHFLLTHWVLDFHPELYPEGPVKAASETNDSSAHGTNDSSAHGTNDSSHPNCTNSFNELHHVTDRKDAHASGLSPGSNGAEHPTFEEWKASAEMEALPRVLIDREWNNQERKPDGERWRGVSRLRLRAHAAFLRSLWRVDGTLAKAENENAHLSDGQVVWKRKEALKAVVSQLAAHKANPESGRDPQFVSAEAKAEYAALKKRRRELEMELGQGTPDEKEDGG